MTKRLRLTATGDALITRRMPLYDDPAFMGMVELIRGCDVAFTNTEVTLSRFRGWPVVESGGMALSVDPRCADDLRQLGFNCTAFANNHTLNYGTGIEQQRQFGEWMNFYPPTAKEGEYSFLNQAYGITDSAMHLRTEPHEGDLAEIARWTAEAKRQAGFAMVSIHAHEQGRERWLPADFLPAFAHAVIDAGADIVVGHGPHLLRGLEFYKGKPIFYSLGNFIFQYETLERFAADDYDTMKRDPAWTPGQVTADLHQGLERSFPADDRYWETVLPICAFEEGRIREITLYPLALGFRQPVWERGIPRLASGAQAKQTLQRFIALSEPFGTRIEHADGIGHVRIPDED
ncbi:MAG: CapA family protein [Thermomicrobia bacterium]|nr:CapA family protein [Thermomicrobia bacterium]